MHVTYAEGAVTLHSASGEQVRISVQDYYTFLGRVMSGNFRPYRDSINLEKGTENPMLYVQPRRTDDGLVKTRVYGIYVTPAEWEYFRGTPREELQIAPLPSDISEENAPNTGSPWRYKG